MRDSRSVCVSVAHERAGVCIAIVGNRVRTVWGYQVAVKINQAFTRDGCRLCSHAVSGMAGGAREPIHLNVFCVPTKAAVAEDLAQIVALST